MQYDAPKRRKNLNVRLLTQTNVLIITVTKAATNCVCCHCNLHLFTKFTCFIFQSFKVHRSYISFISFFLAGTFSTLKANLILKRRFWGYVAQVFAPSILIVFLSMVSFWIDPKQTAARVSLGVICVLTLTTQTASTRLTLPPVSYIRAIDAWIFTCLLFVFLSLLEFACVSRLLNIEKEIVKGISLQVSRFFLLLVF